MSLPRIETTSGVPASNFRLLKLLMAAGLGVFLLSLVVPAFRPVPRLPWYDGVLVETVARLQHGGTIYGGLSSGSLVPAESPYFPGGIFITWLASSLLPIGVYWPRILGGLATLFLLAEIWLTAVRLSASRLAAGLLTVFGVTFYFAAVDKFQAHNFFPDHLLIACAMVAANRMAREVRAPFSIARFLGLGALLFLVGILKQSSFAIFAGFGCFALWPGSDLSKACRLQLLGVLTLAGVAVLAGILATPHCWESTVRAMSGHPTVQTRIPIWILAGVAVLTIATFTLAIRLRRQLPPSARNLLELLIALFIPLLLIQSLSAYKAGGYSYDFLPPLLLALPILVSGFLHVVPDHRRRTALIILGIGSVALSANATVREILRLPVEWKRYRDESAWVERFRGRRALFNVYFDEIVRHAGLQPVTDVHSLTHYALAGLRSDTVLEAIRRREYDVLLGVNRSMLDQTTKNPFFRSPVMREYGEAILQNYRIVEDPDLPRSLEGEVFVPLETPAAR